MKISKYMQLVPEDVRKIAKGALFAAGGAATAYLLSILPSLNFGQYQVFVAMVLSSGLHAAYKYFTKTEYNK